MIKHDKNEQARESFRREFEAVGDKWMGVLFEENEDGSVRCFRTTNAFSVGKFLTAIHLLTKLLTEEQKHGERRVELLPLAPFLVKKENITVDDEHEGEDGDVD
jgi:hypothetical protein